MKANVANYIIQEMSSRFPMRSEDVVNADLIDAVIDTGRITVSEPMAKTSNFTAKDSPRKNI